MKSLILLLFVATIGGFSFSLRSCCQCNLQIAKDLDIDTQEVLNAHASLSGVHPSYDHLDVVLRGTVEQGMRKTAAKLVKAGLRAGRVVNLIQEISPSPKPKPPAEWMFERMGNMVTLKGVVSSATMKTALGESARSIPRIQTVHNELEINAEALSFINESAVSAFARNFIAGAEIGYLQLNEDLIILRGRASSLSAHSSIGKEAAALIKDGVVLNQLEVISSPTTRPLNPN